MKESQMLTVTVGLLFLGLAAGLRAFRGCKRYSNIQPENETKAGVDSVAKTSDDVSVTRKSIKFPRPVKYHAGSVGKDTLSLEEKERLELLKLLNETKNRKELLERMVRVYWRKFKITRAPRNAEEMEIKLKEFGLYDLYVEKVVVI